MKKFHSEKNQYTFVLLLFNFFALIQFFYVMQKLIFKYSIYLACVRGNLVYIFNLHTSEINGSESASYFVSVYALCECRLTRAAKV